MNYQAHYECLIEKARLRVRPSEYCERHHVLPKWQGGADEATNLVWLTGREHFVAHCLLTKWQGGKQWLAVHRMAKGLQKSNSRLYHASRHIVANHLSEVMKEWCRLNPDKLKHPMSDDRRL